MDRLTALIVRKTPAEIEKMRVAGATVARCLKEISERIVPGETTTLDIDVMAEELIRSYDAISSFKNYRGYPNTACVAVNEEVVHGIPGAEGADARRYRGHRPGGYC